ncbi:hypothetical protein WA026_000324 [Henosepilachna vigintioctopunctata]|uniref:Uncharacterized protein n=1 Tax=Henosepilachna vigintioctopunctata TaxID=420089 RepID=A0AAW1V5F6_9CUCU
MLSMDTGIVTDEDLGVYLLWLSGYFENGSEIVDYLKSTMKITSHQDKYVYDWEKNANVVVIIDGLRCCRC